MRPTSGSPGCVLLDTSAAIAFVISDYEQHSNAIRTAGHSLALSGHAAFETYSVLTRSPPPVRRTPEAATRLLQADFPETRYLSARHAAELLESLPLHGISGGFVYDALVGAVANEHGLPLMTLDRRAIVTYRQLGVAVEYPARASNLRRLHGALIALRARRIGSTEPESGVLELDTDFGGIDVHLKPPGAPAYADLRARALRLELKVQCSWQG